MQMSHQVTYDVVATPIPIRDQKGLQPYKRCFYTIMANYNGSLEAVDCHIHNMSSQMSHQVTYDVVATPIRPRRA
eukprot:scaffold8530_cov154-Skeletonema_dohrnii-CCMP3373.AAC.2